MSAKLDQTLPLRAVADRLVQHRVPVKSDKNGFHCLLSLLKAGRIQAVVFFPEVSSDPIPVPQSHWMPLGPEALRPLLNSPKSRLMGTYKIKLKDIASEVVRVAFDTPEKRIGDDYEQLAIQLIKQANQAASVEVLESEWSKYRSELPGNRSLEDEHSKVSGRPAKDWEAVYEELSAILLFTLEKNNIKVTKKVLSGQIVINLQRRGWLDIPDESTIQGRFSRIENRVKALKEQHRASNQ